MYDSLFRPVLVLRFMYCIYTIKLLSVVVRRLLSPVGAPIRQDRILASPSCVPLYP